MKKKILVIEDEEAIADLLVYSLKKEGFDAISKNCGQAGIQSVESFEPNLIILDIMLPDISGFDVCRKINEKHSIPIVMLTARNDTVDKILGLELGADDYITKPFDMRETIARIKSIFRRIELVENGKDQKILTIGDNIKIIEDEHKVVNGDQYIDFTPKEYELLKILCQNKNCVFSRGKLLELVWGYEYEGDTRTVDIHIQRIRKKLDDEKDKSIIETVFGVGYKLVK